jgi:hypothetical protein
MVSSSLRFRHCEEKKGSKVAGLKKLQGEFRKAVRKSYFEKLTRIAASYDTRDYDSTAALKSLD